MTAMNGLKSPMPSLQNPGSAGLTNDMHLKQSMMDMQYKAGGAQDSSFMQSPWMQGSAG